jgi:hypothetical protein
LKLTEQIRPDLLTENSVLLQIFAQVGATAASNLQENFRLVEKSRHEIHRLGMLVRFLESVHDQLAENFQSKDGFLQCDFGHFLLSLAQLGQKALNTKAITYRLSNRAREYGTGR